jgi:polar amino acid transport system substrate-binding protein
MEAPTSKGSFNMKKFISIAVASMVVLSFQPAFAANECNRLTITGHSEYAPIAYRDGDRIVGAAPALVEAIAAELNVPVESKYTGAWADAQAAARDGLADIIFGIYFNDERATYLDYVRPAFMTDPVVVMVAKGKPFPYKDRDDLIGKRGVTNEGESYGADFDAFIVEHLTVVRSKGVDKAFEALLSGNADYVIVGFYPGTAEAARMGLRDKLEQLNPPLLAADMFVAFSKKSPCLSLMGAFSTAIEAMSSDGRYPAMIDDATKAWEASLPKSLTPSSSPPGPR